MYNSKKSMRSRYGQHITSASKRGIETNLSYAEFFELKTGDCYYCGIPSIYLSFYSEHMNVKTPWITIDRKDPSECYDRDNCVPACFLCNKLKSNFFTEKEFLEIAKKYIKPKWEKYTDDVEYDFEEWSYWEGDLDENWD